MKGLLRKDLYLMTRYCKSFLLVAVVFIGLFAMEPSNFFFLLMLCIMLGMLPTTLLSYDEREHWNVYSQALPISKTQYVSAKYLIGLLTGILTAAVVAAICLIRFAGEALVPLLCIALMCSLLPTALLLPLSFQFGTERARYLYFAFMALASFFGASLLTRGEAEAPLESFGLFPVEYWITLLVCLGAVVIYGASWLLAVRLYQRREL